MYCPYHGEKMVEIVQDEIEGGFTFLVFWCQTSGEFFNLVLDPDGCLHKMHETEGTPEEFSVYMDDLCDYSL